MRQLDLNMDLEEYSAESNQKVKNTKTRDLLDLVISFSPAVKILGINEDGDIIFKVPRCETGINNDIYIKYKDEILSTYVRNILGELIVRENINLFSNFLIDLDPETYSELVNKWSHKNFGMEVKKDYITFKFHSSLLQSIIINDL
jgi:hypothetical protein